MVAGTRSAAYYATMAEAERPLFEWYNKVQEQGKKKLKSIYLIGSMKNPEVPLVANRIEKELGIEAFCDWYSPGKDADEYWRDYEKLRGRSFKEAFHGYHAKNVFEFDRYHLDRCDATLLVMPAGKSAHLELGYQSGKGKPGWILFDKEPERLDVMLRFALDVYMSVEEMITGLKEFNNK